jgi:isocitrate dehydrogenase (NAD+)
VFEYFQYAIFEPGTRNTGSSIAGKNIANPISMMNAAADLLHHLQLENHSNWLKEAIAQTISVDKIHTPGNNNSLLN